jgi:hypothetical protein
MTLGEYVTGAAVRIARNTLDGIETGDLRSLGEVDEYIQAQLGELGDDIGDALSTITQPAVQKAIDSMKPAIMQALEDYTPTFAAISGGMLALAVLLGVYVSKLTFERITRRRSGR